MKHAFIDQPWKALLPDTYRWLDTVKIETGTKPLTGAHHVIAVSSGEEGSESMRLDALGLDASVATKLTEAAKSLGWKGAGAPLRTMVDGVGYICVPATKIKTSSIQKSRQLGLDAAKALKDLKVDHIALWQPKDWDVMSVFEGLTAGMYEAKSFKAPPAKDSGDKLPAQVTLLGATADQETVRRAREWGKAMAFTRFLQDAPPNWLNPIRFGDIAKDVASDCGIRCSILNKQEIAAMGMGSFVSVSNGSDLEPRLITLQVDGQDNSKTVTLLGKGMTFDAGGISIKPSEGMGEMKYDMSGGAAVIGAAMYMAKVKPPTRVVCIVGAVENVISGSATRPGDIVVSMSGKTIEVLNTDAEGRLVLADLMTYAIKEYNPDLMIDIATLTGAVLFGLGTAGAALLTNDQASADFVLASAKKGGEPLWQLPMWPELDAEVKSDHADLRNIAKPNIKAGTIIGAMFLKEFAADRKWVHLDIAGTAWNCKATGYPSSGGCGYGMRTMVETCMRYGM